MNLLLILPLVICLISSILSYFFKMGKKENDILSLITNSLVFIFTIVLAFVKIEGTFTLFEITPTLKVSFRIDDISKIFSILISTIWLLVSIYSIKYLEKEERVNKFYAFSNLTLGMMVTLSYASNLLTMYLFFEMVTLLSFPLVMHEKTEESKKAAMKYLYYSLGGAFLGLIAVVAGNLYSLNQGEFVLGGFLRTDMNPTEINFALIALLCGLIGFGAKSGVFPLQAWLPTAHPVAPSPASALLSGMITKAGVICIIRLIFFSFGPAFMKGTYVQYTWEVLILITILLGSTLALVQRNFKRRLAYSSISQLSYVMLGLCTLSLDGFTGSILHVLSHAFIKVGLFLVAGYFIYRYNIRSVDEMEGMGKKNPITMWVFTLLSLALIGVPPTGAFVSKWYLASGSLKANLGAFDYIGAVVLLISAILTAVYLLEISIKAFFPKEKKEYLKEKEPWLMTIPLILLVVGVFSVGIFSGYIVDYIISFIGGAF